MFIRRSTYKGLLAHIEQLVDQRDAAEQDARTYLAASKQTAAKYTDSDDRVVALQRELADTRARLERVSRRADRLQAQYDDAVGLNSSAISDGARWQERRHDKPRPAVTS